MLKNPAVKQLLKGVEYRMISFQLIDSTVKRGRRAGRQL